MSLGSFLMHLPQLLDLPPATEHRTFLFLSVVGILLWRALKEAAEKAVPPQTVTDNPLLMDPTDGVGLRTSILNNPNKERLESMINSLNKDLVLIRKLKDHRNSKGLSEICSARNSLGLPQRRSFVFQLKL